MAGSTRATAVDRAGSGPFSPVYHITVFADVPGAKLVAVANGGPATRCGGSPKKSSAAFTAEAAVSDVSASFPSDVVSAACRLAAVAAALGPMLNSSGPGVVAVVAVRGRLLAGPSGRGKIKANAFSPIWKPGR